MRIFLIALAFALVAPLCLAADISDLERFISEEISKQEITALSVAVSHGDFSWSKGFGTADLENRVPASAESSYRMASVSKPMTAIGILKLVDQGKIDLDAEVQNYVPGFPRKHHPVTIRQLLGHIGGISHYRNYLAEERIREPKNTKEALAIFQDFDLIAEPGTKYSYSSYGFNLLGAVIEGASGRSYADFMRAEVWGPMGMAKTRMDDPREIIPNRVRGYVFDGGRLRNSEYVDISSRFGGGGTRSTVLDMVRLAQGVEKVLKPATIDVMWTSLRTRDGASTGYGLGWRVNPQSGRFHVAHGGSQQETATLLIHLPREKFTFALASNLEDARLSPFAARIALHFLGDSWFLHPYADNAEDQKLLDKLRTDFNDSMALGGFAAQQLAKSGADMKKYHREGELSFWSDFIALRSVPRAKRLDRDTQQKVKRWHREWSALITDELRHARPENVAPSLRGRTLIPNYANDLLLAAEKTKDRRLADLAAELYPRWAATEAVKKRLAAIP